MALVILAHPDLIGSFANRTIIEELKKGPLELGIRRTSF